MVCQQACYEVIDVLLRRSLLKLLVVSPRYVVDVIFVVVMWWIVLVSTTHVYTLFQRRNIFVWQFRSAYLLVSHTSTYSCTVFHRDTRFIHKRAGRSHAPAALLAEHLPSEHYRLPLASGVSCRLVACGFWIAPVTPRTSWDGVSRHGRRCHDVTLVKCTWSALELRLENAGKGDYSAV